MQNNNPRLDVSPGNLGSGQRLTTPRLGVSGSALNELVSRLEHSWHLGLSPREGKTSPRKPVEKSDADRVYSGIQRLYYASRTSRSAQEALDSTLAEFELLAPRRPHATRLRLLLGLLDSQQSPQRTRTPQPDENRILLPKSSAGAPSLPQPEPPAIGQEFPYTIAPGSPSSTEPDEDDYFTPPSPTISSKAAQRRVEASPHLSLNSSKKRPSDSSNDAGSPKLSRTYKGRQPSVTHHYATATSGPDNTSRILFKKPSRDMAPSFQAVSAETSFKTSFNSNPMWSQQSGSGPSTANTSFASDVAANPPEQPKSARTSSTTYTDSLNDSARTSSLAFGSIDEQAMLDAFSRRDDKAPFPGRTRSPNAGEAMPNTPQTRRLGPVSTPTSKHSPKDSPTRMSHRIRNIPSQNLFVDDIPAEGRILPYFILFICTRLTIQLRIPLEELLPSLDTAWSDRDAFKNSIRRHKMCSNADIEPKAVWQAQKSSFDGYTFRGRLILNRRTSGPVFNLELQPLQADPSCRLQRRFGTDRFLYLNVPAFDSGSGYNKSEMKLIEEQFKIWFCTEHAFLGRKWRAFHIEPIKKKKLGRREDDLSDKRIILFATEGCGISESWSLGKFLNWFFPFEKNQQQSFCKAYARLDLGLSRTTPTLEILPSQLRYVGDIVAQGELEDRQFNDPNLDWNEPIDENAVMNDGCSVLSVGAAQAIWKIYKEVTGTNDPLPSAFQARIGGAKGVWVVSAESYSRDPDHKSIWIEITPSQLKFQPPPEDESDTSFDRHRLTFEICRYSTQAHASDLHISFIPIMMDRGVSQEAFVKVMTERLEMEREQILDLLPDPVRLYDWVHKQSSESGKSDDMPWQAALPSSLPDRIKLLIEAGFNPTEEPYLANCLDRFITYELLSREKSLRIPLGKATYLYGVADPLRILPPGKVHIRFSTRFVDEMADESYLGLDNIDVLVGRQPACRRSDMQKVHAVVYPELSHLVDVVVFPTRGQYPLAGKLQGGDYDGDIFWVCWEPDLVSSFQNAPAPMQPLNPAKYGIQKDARKLYDVMENLSDVDSLLKEILDFRMSPSLLGMATNFLTNRSYFENRIYSEVLSKLCDMHDLLVDGPKQGYTFTEKDFQRYVREDLRCRDPGVPVYKKAMNEREKPKEMGEAKKAREKVWRFNKDNIIDFLYFNVVMTHHSRTLDEVSTTFSKTHGDDPILQHPYRHLDAEKSPMVNQEMAILKDKITEVWQLWASRLNQHGGNIKAGYYNSAVAECYKKYEEIMPINQDNQVVNAWLRHYHSRRSCFWDTLRASALYTLFPGRSSFVYHMAGKQLARLKGEDDPESRIIGQPIYTTMRPKIKRIQKQFEDDSTESTESTGEFVTPSEGKTLDEALSIDVQYF
ncbi:hypothetical protein EJ04DRAFT_490091 [Polyplosphaeria fusca]|uniref:RNA-dependent RNA polymerase n=1 Tax=Polyplosphaeria fusca TaxID=682080 RepID=A0A9P4QZ79_9PLEO|nr:hypothetical protein EJ04DRAFT_490091 [Polyplosphaeria fusca]